MVMCRDAKKQENLRGSEDSSQTLRSSQFRQLVLLVHKSRKEKPLDSSFKQMLNSRARPLGGRASSSAHCDAAAVEAKALTFEGFINVAAEIVDPVSVIEFWISSSGHSILCDINWRVVVLLLQPVQDPPEAKRGHLQPEGAGVWPRAVCDGSNSPASLQGKDQRLLVSSRFCLWNPPCPQNMLHGDMVALHVLSSAALQAVPSENGSSSHLPR